MQRIPGERSNVRPLSANELAPLTYEKTNGHGVCDNDELDDILGRIARLLRARP
jgi:hypothetical protein